MSKTNSRQPPRIHCALALREGDSVALPADAARHVQVLRLQPGSAITVFNGHGGEYAATVRHMGRSEVTIGVGEHRPVEREPARCVHLLVGMPANERMDWLVEKATELGVSSIQPLLTARSVLRLQGERASKRQAHWQGIAIAACEQCGRNRLPLIHPVMSLDACLAQHSTARAPDDAPHANIVLSLAAPAVGGIRQTVANARHITALLGPEGGFTQEEENQALACGFAPATLGARTLRTETAALAIMAGIAALDD